MRRLWLLAVPVLITACAGTPRPFAAGPGSSELQPAAAAADAGHYREAIDAYKKAAALPKSDSPGEALFQAAYLQAYYENPQPDYAAAMQGFEQYVKLYPKGPRVKEARNWSFLLKTILDLRKENGQLTQKIDQLTQIDIHQEEKRGQ
jgi:TolA-binding protein